MLEKLRKAEFTFDDFLAQMHEMRKMGPIEQILGMLPGVPAKELKNLRLDEKELRSRGGDHPVDDAGERRNPRDYQRQQEKRASLWAAGPAYSRSTGSYSSLSRRRRLMRQIAEAVQAGPPVAVRY